MSQRKASAPTYHSKSARCRTAASPIVAQPRDAGYYAARKRDDDLRRNFKAGFYLGLLVGLVILCAVLFLWAVPTVDGCVQSLKELQGAVA